MIVWLCHAVVMAVSEEVQLRFLFLQQDYLGTLKISKSERIPLAGSQGLLLLNQGLLLPQDGNWSESENFFDLCHYPMKTHN